MIIDLCELSTNQVYYTFIQTIIPRPVAWVLSSNGGRAKEPWNLAPFSYFNGVSSNPPLISLSIGIKPDGNKKDTAKNIDERDYFVIHIPHRELAQNVTDSAAVLDHGESELNLVNVELEEMDFFPVPKIKAARIAFFCKKDQIIEIGNTPQSFIIASVEKIFIDDLVGVQDEKGRLTVDPIKVDPVSRLGGNDYGLFGEKITVIRPK